MEKIDLHTDIDGVKRRKGVNRNGVIATKK